MTERGQVPKFTDTLPDPNIVPRIVGKDIGSGAKQRAAAYRIGDSY